MKTKTTTLKTWRLNLLMCIAAIALTAFCVSLIFISVYSTRLEKAQNELKQTHKEIKEVNLACDKAIDLWIDEIIKGLRLEDSIKALTKSDTLTISRQKLSKSKLKINNIDIEKQKILYSK